MAAAPKRGEEIVIKLTELFCRLIESRFTGQIIFNFSQGGLGRIEKREQIKLGRDG